MTQEEIAVFETVFCQHPIIAEFEDLSYVEGVMVDSDGAYDGDVDAAGEDLTAGLFFKPHYIKH